MSKNPLNRFLNRMRWLVFAAFLALAFGSAAFGQTLLYKWNFDNGITTGVTNLSVSPAVIDTADGYTGGNLTNIFNALGLQSIPSGSGVYGIANSADQGLVNSATNGQVGTQPASGALVGGVGNLSGITNQFTITMWFNLSATYTNNGNARLFDIDTRTAANGAGSADGNELYLDLAGGTQAIQMGVNQASTGPLTGANVLTNTTSLSGITNIWFFMALVYTNSGTGSVGIYVGRTNATAVLSTTLNGVGVLANTNAWNNITNLVMIGNRASDAKRNLPGTIDDVRFYKEALSQAQIQSIQGVLTAPVITSQPTPDVVFPGQSPQFKVTATGSVPLRYQWQRNGTNLLDGGNISGSQSNVLTIAGVSAADVFNNYQVVVTNSVNPAAISTPVSLSLTQTNGAYEAAVLTNSPFAFYTFSETGDPSSGALEAYDSIGVFNGIYGAGALNGFNSITGPQTTADSLIGFPDTNTALFATYQNFPVAAYVATPAFNLNNGVGTNVLTIAAWIKPIGAQAHGVGIIFSRSGNTVAGLDYNATNSNTGNLKLGYTWNNDSTTFSWDSGLEPTPGIWSLVALVITPTNSTIYLINANGLLFSTHNHTNVIQTFSGPTLIGNDSLDTTGKRNFNGSIDEVAFFNQALTPGQMSSLYSAASGTVFAPQPPTISVEPTWPSPVYVGQSVSSTVTSIGGLSYQWKAGLGGNYTNLTDGANISGSSSSTLTINSVQISNSLDYIVIVANSFGSITSTPPATLTVNPPGSPNAYTLDFGGAPIVEAAGSDWNTANSWNPDGAAASTSAFSNPGSTYTVVAGSRLRTPVLANVIFPGITTLQINGDGVFEGSGTNPVTIGELRIKHTAFNPATNFYSHLVLNGGEIFNGDGGLIVLKGRLDVQANSVLYNDAVDTRAFQIDSWLTGSGNIFYQDGNLTNGAVDLNVTGTTNTFIGQWVISQGGLLGASINSLGTNTLSVGATGLAAAVETLYDINNTNASLILGTNGKVYLHQNDHFASVIINGTPLANGTYSFAQLTNSYPANFPATWTAQTGSTVTTGSGQIIVGTGGPAPAPRFTGISLSGTSLSLSITNGAPGGPWALLQSTNIALPLSQWQTNRTGSFDFSGNLFTNIVNTATNSQEFYILKQ
ncbi:MAG TPA: LamG-like jellyroll fold domain-containing protein [Verrucomicrobiae bacterium]|nr:LamG-like jellyroll fold domain-containing protein [Verrucomicrobiae bacterium]